MFKKLFSRKSSAGNATSKAPQLPENVFIDKNYVCTLRTDYENTFVSVQIFTTAARAYYRITHAQMPGEVVVLYFHSDPAGFQLILETTLKNETPKGLITIPIEEMASLIESIGGDQDITDEDNPIKLYTDLPVEDSYVMGSGGGYALNEDLRSWYIDIPRYRIEANASDKDGYDKVYKNPIKFGSIPIDYHCEFGATVDRMQRVGFKTTVWSDGEFKLLHVTPGTTYGGLSRLILMTIDGTVIGSAVSTRGTVADYLEYYPRSFQDVLKIYAYLRVLHHFQKERITPEKSKTTVWHQIVSRLLVNLSSLQASIPPNHDPYEVPLIELSIPTAITGDEESPLKFMSRDMFFSVYPDGTVSVALNDPSQNLVSAGMISLRLATHIQGMASDLVRASSVALVASATTVPVSVAIARRMAIASEAFVCNDAHRRIQVAQYLDETVTAYRDSVINRQTDAGIVQFIESMKGM